MDGEDLLSFSTSNGEPRKLSNKNVLKDKTLYFDSVEVFDPAMPVTTRNDGQDNASDDPRPRKRRVRAGNRLAKLNRENATTTKKLPSPNRKSIQKISSAISSFNPVQLSPETGKDTFLIKNNDLCCSLRDRLLLTAIFRKHTHQNGRRMLREQGRINRLLRSRIDSCLGR